MNELKNDPMYQDLKERFDKIETKMDNIINLLSEKCPESHNKSIKRPTKRLKVQKQLCQPINLIF